MLSYLERYDDEREQHENRSKRRHSENHANYFIHLHFRQSVYTMKERRRVATLQCRVRCGLQARQGPLNIPLADFL